MYIAMNRFKVKLGHEAEFIQMWKNRDSYLDEVPGFIEFRLLRGSSNDEYTLISSQAIWESEEAFRAWTKSDAFKNAHKGARSSKDTYAGPPQLECFEVVL